MMQSVKWFEKNPPGIAFRFVSSYEKYYRIKSYRKSVAKPKTGQLVLSLELTIFKLLNGWLTTGKTYTESTNSFVGTVIIIYANVS